MRSVIIAGVMAALFGSPSLTSAQGFGVGARIGSLTADSEADADAIRVTGGQIRLLTGRWGLEVSMDRHSATSDALNQKVTETPIQLSLLMRLTESKLSPFLLGGRGWYRRKVELLEGPDEGAVKTSESGWHGGGGLEIRAARHFALHGDYRYTFLDFGDDDEDDGFIGGLLPGHRGSMWTIGATIYF